MAEIIYFGTKGCSGHCAIGIDKTLTKMVVIQNYFGKVSIQKKKL